MSDPPMLRWFLDLRLLTGSPKLMKLSDLDAAEMQHVASDANASIAETAAQTRRLLKRTATLANASEARLLSYFVQNHLLQDVQILERLQIVQSSPKLLALDAHAKTTLDQS